MTLRTAAPSASARRRTSSSSEYNSSTPCTFAMATICRSTFTFCQGPAAPDFLLPASIARRCDSAASMAARRSKGSKADSRSSSAWTFSRSGAEKPRCSSVSTRKPRRRGLEPVRLEFATREEMEDRVGVVDGRRRARRSARAALPAGRRSAHAGIIFVRDAPPGCPPAVGISRSTPGGCQLHACCRAGRLLTVLYVGLLRLPLPKQAAEALDAMHEVPSASWSFPGSVLRSAPGSGGPSRPAG